MSPRTGKGHLLRRTAAAAAVAAGFVAVSACGTDGTPASADAPTSGGARAASPAGKRPTALPDFRKAYEAGYEAGRTLHDAGGKGAAVREVVGGGCARRALEAGAKAGQDRGSWVKGCHDGVGDAPQHPPARPLTKRELNPRLLEGFQAWARNEGDTATARHAGRVFTVELTRADYDVEVSTDYSSRAEAEEFAAAFAQWWDADDGPGVARNLVILDAGGQRMATEQL
ncbi:hypothetical protein [Streptomyces lydicus]|uniref:hypothetical protein n=1 Tax=Streptomyces lydicus TaxID=47763 RepID=UPI001010FA09|nr:hypothetical protein [Streptomyces lydicus]MCZ1006642.1 hypothetical protein [Streptomyces lydicus]